MRRSTARGGTALGYIALVTFAQLLMPGLAQTGPTATIGVPAQLQPGSMPFTTEQLGCFIKAAAESEALQTYFEVSALLGLASAYGNSSDFMEELMTVPDMAELMELPLSTVNSNYEAWVTLTMKACGMPELLDSTSMELTSDQVVTWFNSMKTTDLLAGMNFDMTPTDDDEALANNDFTSLLIAAGMPTSMRRRLLFWAWKAWAAKASGAVFGFGSSILSTWVATKAAAIVGTALAVVAAPASITALAGMATFAAVSSLAKKEVDTLGAPLIRTMTNDTKVLDAFTSSMDYGSAAHAALINAGISSTKDMTSAKLTRLMANSDVKGKAKEWAAKQVQAQLELAWAEANADNPKVAKLLPELLAKAGAARRLAAVASDVSRENWKAVAVEVVKEAVEEAGLNPADVLTDGLAAALEPTPGVEPNGELTADTIDLVLPDAEDIAGEATTDTPEEDSSALDEGGSTADDAATGEGGEGDTTADDGTTVEGGTTADDGTIDQGDTSADDSAVEEGDTSADDGTADDGDTAADDAALDEVSSTADDGAVDEGSSTADDGATEASDSTADDGADWGDSSADDGAVDEGSSTADDAAADWSGNSTDDGADSAATGTTSSAA